MEQSGHELGRNSTGVLMCAWLQDCDVLSLPGFQWSLPAEGSKAQQRAFVHGERAGRALPARIIASCSAISGPPGLLLLFYFLYLRLCALAVDDFSERVHLLQEKRMLQNVRQFQVPLQRYTALMDLQVSPSTSPRENLDSQSQLQLARLLFQS